MVCFAEGSTGFTGQHLMAEFLLRREPIEVYDKYISNEIKMDDPRIVAALEEMGEILRNEKYVAGGPSNVATQDWRVAANGILTKPTAVLHVPGGNVHTDFIPRR